MHELGVLNHAVRTVERIAMEQGIRRIKHITLEVGEGSSYVPRYLEKLFPLAAEQGAAVKTAQLRIVTVAGEGIRIRDIGY